MGHKRFYLELPRETEVPIVGLFPDGHVLRREILPEPHLSRLLYAEVGRDYQWTDRLEWTDRQWTYHFMKPQLQLWVLWAVTEPAGYFELRREDDDESVEIAYFGLRPGVHGPRPRRPPAGLRGQARPRHRAAGLAAHLHEGPPARPCRTTRRGGSGSTGRRRSEGLARVRVITTPAPMDCPRCRARR